MHKSNKQSKLAILYNDLNSEGKKILQDRFKEQFDLKTDARLYKLLGKPHLLTGLETDFLSKAFACPTGQLLERTISMIPIQEIISTNRSKSINSTNHVEK